MSIEVVEIIAVIFAIIVSMFAISKYLVNSLKEKIKDLEDKVYELDLLAATLKGMYIQETGNINPFILSKEIRDELNVNSPRKTKKRWASPKIWS